MHSPHKKLLAFCVTMVWLSTVILHAHGHQPAFLKHLATWKLNPFGNHSPHYYWRMHPLMNSHSGKPSSSPSCCLPSTYSYQGSIIQQTQQGDGKSNSYYSESFEYRYDLEKKLFRADFILPNMAIFPPSVTLLLLVKNNTTYNYINTTEGCWCFKVHVNPWARSCVMEPYQRSVSFLENMPPQTLDMYGQEIVQSRLGNYEKISIWTIPIAKKESFHHIPSPPSSTDNVHQCWILNEQIVAHSQIQNVTETYSANMFGFSSKAIPESAFQVAPNCPPIHACDD